MRPGTQPQVGGPGPVLDVVAAAIVAQASSLWSLPGEIGHFVVEIAPRRQEVGGQEEKFPLGFFIRGAEFARRPPAGRRHGRSPAARVQLIARQMFRGEAQGLLQGLEPGVQGLPRQTIHQIQPQVGETRRPDQIDGRLRLPGRMPPTQKPQFRLVKGLHPQAQAVNAQVPEEPSICRR